MTTGTFYGIGVGPGDSGLITVKGANLLRQSRHVFVPKARIASDSVALAIAREYLSPAATIHELVFPMTRNEAELNRRWRESAESVSSVLLAGHDACFLTLGDPLVYSTYIYLARALTAKLPGLRVETVPGITSFCAAAALTNFPLGEQKDPITIIPASDDLRIVREALSRGGTIVLMKVGERLQDIVRILMELSLADQAVFVSHAGQPTQRVELDIRKLEHAETRAGYLSVILVHATRRASS